MQCFVSCFALQRTVQLSSCQFISFIVVCCPGIDVCFTFRSTAQYIWRYGALPPLVLVVSVSSMCYTTSRWVARCPSLAQSSLTQYDDGALNVNSASSSAHIASTFAVEVIEGTFSSITATCSLFE